MYIDSSVFVGKALYITHHSIYPKLTKTLNLYILAHNLLLHVAIVNLILLEVCNAESSTIIFLVAIWLKGFLVHDATPKCRHFEIVLVHMHHVLQHSIGTFLYSY